MSYDIDLIVDHGDGYKTTVHDCNITYNLRKMFVAAGLEDSFHSLQGIVAADAQDLLYGVWHELRTRPDFYRQFDSPNGWGMHENALPFIRKLYLSTRLHPRAVIHVY